MTKQQQAIWEDGHTQGRLGKRAECKRLDEYEQRVWRNGYKAGLNSHAIAGAAYLMVRSVV